MINGKTSTQPIDITDVKNKLQAKHDKYTRQYNKWHKVTDGNWEQATVKQKGMNLDVTTVLQPLARSFTETESISKKLECQKHHNKIYTLA